MRASVFIEAGEEMGETKEYLLLVILNKCCQSWCIYHQESRLFRFFYHSPQKWTLWIPYQVLGSVRIQWTTCTRPWLIRRPKEKYLGTLVEEKRGREEGGIVALQCMNCIIEILNDVALKWQFFSERDKVTKMSYILWIGWVWVLSFPCC